MSIYEVVCDSSYWISNKAINKSNTEKINIGNSAKPTLYQRPADVVGRYLTFLNISGNTNSTGILVCSIAAQFVPSLSWLGKTSKFYWNLFNKIFHVLPILFANNFYVLLCTFCLVKLS